MGKTGYYPKGYIPDAALPKPKGEGEEELVRDVEEVLKEMVRETSSWRTTKHDRCI